MEKRYAPARSRFHVPFCIVLIAVLTCVLPSSAFSGAPVIGQHAPDFALPGLLDAQMLSLKDLKGKVVLLNIWASWCSSCKDEMEDLVSVLEQYGPRGFALVAVNIDNAPSSAIDFMKKFERRTKKKTGFILLHDRDKTVSKEYQQRGMPTSYLIDREGILRKIYPGSFSNSTLETLKAAIEEALQ